MICIDVDIPTFAERVTALQCLLHAMSMLPPLAAPRRVVQHFFTAWCVLQLYDRDTAAARRRDIRNAQPHRPHLRTAPLCVRARRGDGGRRPTARCSHDTELRAVHDDIVTWARRGTPPRAPPCRYTA